MGGAAAAVLAPPLLGLDGTGLLLAIVVGTVAAPTAYLIWTLDPAYVFTGAFILAPFSNNWEGVGVPGILAPDRILLIGAIATVLFRGPAVRDRGPIRVEAVHWVMAAAIAYAVISALAVEAFDQREPFFRLLEAYGVLPFFVFLCAPIAFRNARERRVLLWGIVGLGAYLGLTAMFEGLNFDALVFPRYILDPAFGIHADYARGPFVEASTNGLALFSCAIASLMTVLLVRDGRWRLAAAVVCCVCLVAAFFTMERSVWIGVVVSSLVAVAVLGPARRFLVPVLAIGTAGLIAALIFVPGLASQADDRLNTTSTAYDRLNMNTAAVAMIEDRPLLGFGWGGYAVERDEFFEQSPNYPLVGQQNIMAHNVFLNNAAELGLIGVTLWLVALGGMLIGALRTPVAGDLRAWRASLIPLAVMCFIVMNFTPIKNFSTLLLCLWAGVVWSARYTTDEPSPHRRALG